MSVDRWALYRQMLRSRRFEEAVHRLWTDGLISGEMHLGTGTEAVAAGVVTHLRDGDAMALDHRGTPQLVIRGVDLLAVLRECLGQPGGLCGGRGGHMHLFSPDHLSASSGIVGASAPAAVGFGLSAQHRRSAAVAVGFFGEGAMNQGMVMESFNLAVVWRLPVIFVCKDNGWSITTRSRGMTGGDLLARARSFGMAASAVDGIDAEAVWWAAARAVARARAGDGPSFLLARCVHLEGHFLGDPLQRVVRHPIQELSRMAGPLVRSGTATGGPLGRRVAGLTAVGTAMGRMAWDDLLDKRDPVRRLRRRLTRNRTRLDAVERDVTAEIEQVVRRALDEATG